MTFRVADESDMVAIYLMGYDVWGDGQPQATYLEICRSAPKYKRGRWFVLTDNQEGAVSSLIVYRDAFQLASHAAGIGSIATPTTLRGRGYAAELVRSVVALLAKERAEQIYLFSDIAPEYYEKLGFKKLPANHQKYPGTVCMVWESKLNELSGQADFTPPTYF